MCNHTLKASVTRASCEQLTALKALPQVTFSNGAGAYKIFYLFQSLRCAALTLSPVIKV